MKITKILDNQGIIKDFGDPSDIYRSRWQGRVHMLNHDIIQKFFDKLFETLLKSSFPKWNEVPDGLDSPDRDDRSNKFDGNPWIS